MSVSSFNRAMESSKNSVQDGTLLAPNDVARRLKVSVAWVRDHSTRKHPVDIEQWIEDLRATGIRRAS